MCKNNKQIRTRRFLSGRRYQIVAAFIGSLSALSAGISMGWLAQINEELLNGDMGFPIDKEQLGWVGAVVPLGAAAFTPFTGPICDRLGRKTTMLLLVVPYLIAWCLIIWPQTIAMLYVGRFLSGMVSGALVVLPTIYVNELAEKELRGTLVSFNQLMINAGSLYPSIIALFLSVQYYNIFCAAITLISGALLIFIPETPVHLLRKGKVNEAQLVLESVRNSTYNVIDEMMEIKERIDNHVTNGFNLSSFKSSNVQMACVVGFGLMIFKRTCGFAAVSQYTTYIFQGSQLHLSAQIQTVIVTAVLTVASVVQTSIIKRAGRKLLLLVFSITMTISLLVIGAVFLVKNRGVINPDYYIYADYLLLVAIIGYVLSYSLGLGSIPWIIMGELFPQELKSIATSIATTIFWVTSFATTKLFLVVDGSLGIDVAFFMFAASTFITFTFVLVLVKETKGIDVT